jgi:hypothetical protein
MRNPSNVLLDNWAFIIRNVMTGGPNDFHSSLKAE